MKYRLGYEDVRRAVLEQSVEADEQLIDSLEGRGALNILGMIYGPVSPKQIKREALRQLEIEWREDLETEAGDASAADVLASEQPRRGRCLATIGGIVKGS